jgi:hypothetical protein
MPSDFADLLLFPPQGIARSTDVVAAIMLLMAAAIAGYAIFLYLQRSKKLDLIGDEVRGGCSLRSRAAAGANIRSRGFSTAV